MAGSFVGAGLRDVFLIEALGAAAPEQTARRFNAADEENISTRTSRGAQQVCDNQQLIPKGRVGGGEGGERAQAPDRASFPLVSNNNRRSVFYFRSEKITQ